MSQKAALRGANAAIRIEPAKDAQTALDSFVKERLPGLGLSRLDRAC